MKQFLKRLIFPIILFTTSCSASPENDIIQRWKMTDVQGNNEDFRREQLARQMEMEFTKENRCLIYEGGVMKNTVQYTMAPDGKSVVVNMPGTAEQASMSIVSLSDDELKIVAKVFGTWDTLVFKPR